MQQYSAGWGPLAPTEENLDRLAFLQAEIRRWKRCQTRQMQLLGEAYYLGRHDILQRRRTAIGENGQLQEVHNLPNNKIVDNQYAKMVDQKVNYLLGKPLTFDTQNARFQERLKKLLGRSFQRILKNLGEDSLNGGIAWLHPYYDERGSFCFKRFEPCEILPFWRNAEHTELLCAVRLYEEPPAQPQLKGAEHVELYTPEGVEHFVWQNDALVPDALHPPHSYVTLGERNYNWGRVPLVAFKYNNKETPLIGRVKLLQDSLNTMISDFTNNMQEDARNTILVIKNYDGENLGEFRKNLSAYGAVKVRTIDGVAGEVDTLTVDVNAANYRAILDVLKKALIDNARGYDAKDERLSGNPNQMHLLSMYADMDLDATGMEIEYQAGLEELLWFVCVHFANHAQGDFLEESVNVIFNRDMIVLQGEAIDGVMASVGLLSKETLISQHPYVDDVQKELARLRAETLPAPPDSGEDEV